MLVVLLIFARCLKRLFHIFMVALVQSVSCGPGLNPQSYLTLAIFVDCILYFELLWIKGGISFDPFFNKVIKMLFKKNILFLIFH